MRGFWYVIEAVIAGIIIMGFLVVVGNNMIPGVQEDPGLIALGTLKGLEEQGVLRNHLTGLDYSGLDSKIEIPGFSHAVEICDTQACAGSRPEAENVWTGSYILAESDFYTVRLYLWRIT